jgi:hypothetical protein
MADEDSDANSTSTSSGSGVGLFQEETQRDEVKEVRKIAEKETSRVRVWRFVVTCVLLATALAVTLTTYYSLEREEQDKFERAVSDRCLVHAIRRALKVSLTKKLCPL